MTTSLASAHPLAARDDLTGYRDAFVQDGDLIYMDGNSLGRLPRAMVERMGEVGSTGSSGLSAKRIIAWWKKSYAPSSWGGSTLRYVGICTCAVQVCYNTPI